MHARLSLLTATAAVLLATSAMAAPPTSSSASSTPAAASSPAAPMSPAASTRTAASNASRTTTGHANTNATQQALYTRAQQKLKDMGLYSGPIDGSRNAAYVSALRKFQRDHHLQVSGRLNTQTQRALGI